ncbi:FAD-binding oxidoreductase [Actinocrispum wychmicini]|uniref:FAD/FMN-containing dehydrogenase n=1 Tax=Actinocrispum wychmicini TaxID=1213861 RepID=A0A4R2JS90_9PSEU|nr:FAD-binding oxidoreductase [Actinocrispum wychmicini]TCO59739.1 FAD/FMN-containing dehydrogenase [Actinocrispum wychmicini]
MTQQLAARRADLFRGPVHRPGDAAYDTQRASLDPTFDARPAVIVEATGPADVRAAVTWARANDLPIAVQSTGHGTRVASDGGLLLKTARMATVQIDPDRRIARVGAGAVWGDVLAAAAPYGLAPVSGSSPTVGVAGFTLGGGLGPLSRAYGLGADNLVRIDLVTADGEPVTATPDDRPELFWAVRGGGGNFGVVTSMEIRLHPVTKVYAGQALFPIDRAADLLARYRDYAPVMPDELTCTIALVGGHVAVRATYAGDAATARRALRPLSAGIPVHDTFAEVTVPQASVPGTAPRQFDLFAAIPDGLIESLVDVPGAVEVRYWGGAIGRFEGPAGHRGVPFSIAVDGAAECLRPYATGGSFLNFLHDPHAVETAYTAADYQRLRAVKAAYDPSNVFHRNMNIPPAVRGGGIRGALLG